MPYTVRIKESALKALAKLPAADRVRITARVDALAADPRPQGITKMAGPEGLYRIRVGQYRIIYAIHDRILLVLVVRIGHRRDVYRP
jgi:mRNA interferase RelE/StbE